MSINEELIMTVRCDDCGLRHKFKHYGFTSGNEVMKYIKKELPSGRTRSEPVEHPWRVALNKANVFAVNHSRDNAVKWLKQEGFHINDKDKSAICKSCWQARLDEMYAKANDLEESDLTDHVQPTNDDSDSAFSQALETEKLLMEMESNGSN